MRLLCGKVLLRFLFVTMALEHFRAVCIQREGRTLGRLSERVCRFWIYGLKGRSDLWIFYAKSQQEVIIFESRQILLSFLVHIFYLRIDAIYELFTPWFHPSWAVCCYSLDPTRYSCSYKFLYTKIKITQQINLKYSKIILL